MPTAKKKQNQPIAAGTGALLLFLLVGAAWAGLVRVVPPGPPRSVVAVGVGFAVLATYVWLLLGQVRVILRGTERLRLHALLAAAEVVTMLVAFGAVYQHLGIMDNSLPGTPVVHEFWTSVYYAVVTFTTLGYGDFYPRGAGRALAGMQALTGYLVLGLLASAAASVISPHSPAGSGGEDRERAEE